jgi:hypothetical protein
MLDYTNRKILSTDSTFCGTLRQPAGKVRGDAGDGPVQAEAVRGIGGDGFGVTLNRQA